MQITTLESVKYERKLQDEAHRLEERLELLTRHGVTRAEELLDAAWARYNRRTYRVNVAFDAHWGVL